MTVKTKVEIVKEKILLIFGTLVAEKWRNSGGHRSLQWLCCSPLLRSLSLSLFACALVCVSSLSRARCCFRSQANTRSATYSVLTTEQLCVSVCTFSYNFLKEMFYIIFSSSFSAFVFVLSCVSVACVLAAYAALALSFACSSCSHTRSLQEQKDSCNTLQWWAQQLSFPYFLCVWGCEGCLFLVVAAVRSCARIWRRQALTRVHLFASDFSCSFVVGDLELAATF